MVYVIKLASRHYNVIHLNHIIIQKRKGLVLVRDALFPLYMNIFGNLTQNNGLKRDIILWDKEANFCRSVHMSILASSAFFGLPEPDE